MAFDPRLQLLGCHTRVNPLHGLYPYAGYVTRRLRAVRPQDLPVLGTIVLAVLSCPNAALECGLFNFVNQLQKLFFNRYPDVALIHGYQDFVKACVKVFHSGLTMQRC